MIFILGFGRSGTTWISDVISKSLGGLVLFEPLHPQVLTNALEFCYYDGKNNTQNSQLKIYIDGILKGDFSHRWMIRNHLPTPLESPSDWYVQQILENCKIKGFKEIRANFIIDFLKANYPDSHILFVKRNPFAVLASIKKRNRFWEEFTMDAHIKRFTHTIRNNEYLTAAEKDQYEELISTYNKPLELSAILWIYTHKIVDRNLSKYNDSPISYEELYFSPYEGLTKLVTKVGGDPKRMHPSYIFTPSMLTLKTRHTLMNRSVNQIEGYNDLFWKNSLSSEEIRTTEELFNKADYLNL